MAEVVFVETFFLGGGIGLDEGEEGGAEDFWGRKKKRKRVSEMSLGQIVLDGNSPFFNSLFSFCCDSPPCCCCCCCWFFFFSSAIVVLYSSS